MENKTIKNNYNKDFYQWTKSQSSYLKKKDFEKLDIENLREEIESLGKSDKRALLSHIIILLLHLLKIDFQKNLHSKSWDNSIENARLQIDLILADSPSLRKELPSLFEKAYKYARKKAAIETNLEETKFPEDLPWKIKEIL